MAGVEFSTDYIPLASRLALMEFPDEAIARFFGVGLAELAEWAWLHPGFYDAITPPMAALEEQRRMRKAEREKINLYRRKRRQDPKERIVEATRARIWAALRGRSDGALFSRLGYSKADLISHIEKRFTPGMAWNNYGRWHVDHIRPCASYDMTDASQFAECWALSNLQPLWAADNIRKGAKYAPA
ncbi:conserved hypothetical protein [Hyphomicrobiales bacterium]|nr:conserved hypothetical protein [Hyphomicrobiales bacterium]